MEMDKNMFDVYKFRDHHELRIMQLEDKMRKNGEFIEEFDKKVSGELDRFN